VGTGRDERAARDGPAGGPICFLAPRPGPAFQRRSVGYAQIREGLGAAAALGWESAFVICSPGYYGHSGFRLRIQVTGFPQRGLNTSTSIWAQVRKACGAPE